jgi:hypothetical protein
MSSETQNADVAGSAVLLPPPAASQFLAKWGVRAATPTLAKLRCVGGGPAFHRYGRRIVYERLELIRWIEARLSPARVSTSDRNEVHHGK